MDIGQRIKKLRQNLDLTQTDLANEIDVSKQTLYKYESGIVTNIPSDKIESLARVLNTTPAYLMGWTDDPIDYDNLDIDIPTWWEGTVKGYLEFREALDKDQERESSIQSGHLTSDETERNLLLLFRKLNDTGKEKAVDYVEDLGDNPKYSAAATATPPAPEPDHLTVIAAHNDRATEPGQLELMRQDVERAKKLIAERRKK